MVQPPAPRRRWGVPDLVRIGRFQRDARVFLVSTLVLGAALSLYWIDFNLYLRSLGFSTATVGLVATISSTAGAVTALPASALSDRIGRRAVMAGGVIVGVLALIGLLSVEALPLIIGFAALWAIGQQSLMVVQAPFLAEHSDAEHRNDLFALQAAIQTVTNVVAAALGGIVATAIAGAMGSDPDGPTTYRVILVIMVGLLMVGLVTIGLLGDDRPSRMRSAARLKAIGEPAAFPPQRATSPARMGIVIRDRRRFVRLLLPGFLIAIGAGQVIPFLNVFVQQKFGLELASLNALFAFTSLGTVAAMLAQPAMARRFGQITSVVIVQAFSIPFLVVLGFSPILWTVVLAMVVRNSLMNAGNPIFSAFAMEHVSPAERATLSASMSLLWQIGWVVGGGWYALLQATLGFTGGYAVNFLTVISLYSIATLLYWAWFGAADRRAAAERRLAA
ncbi:MAG TPA: MFS transporter [Candidatus Limnocylindria bacterium]|jgi:MFS family permease|nr:MFS transporter [Candidatus Limnocylindria bacterium]